MSEGRKYRCTNAGECSRADAKIITDLQPGDDAVCPECRQRMDDISVDNNSVSSLSKKKTLFIVVAIVAGIILLVGGGIYYVTSKAIEVKDDLTEKGKLAVIGALFEAKKRLELHDQKGPGQTSSGQSIQPPIKEVPGGAPVPTPPPIQSPGASAADSKALVEDGMTAVKKMKYDDASALFRRAADKDQKNPEAFGNIGAISIIQGRIDEGIEATNRAIALDSDNYRWHANLAELYSKKGDKAKALNSLEKAVSLGFRDRSLLKKHDFKLIENDPRYLDLEKKM
jgi:tetratricopeptide (TPR) repeat protein